ncbi:MAG: Na+/H+ antiporter subunit E [Idiomarina sp.]|nr:Na+/H+ antiporter subunit E [Idiomarina sp.]
MMLRHVSFTLLLFLGLWWVLTEGRWSSYTVGIPAAVACTWIAMRLGAGLETNKASALQPLQVPLFFFHFVGKSLIAGFDVARRTLQPSMPLQPGFVSYPLQLQSEPAKLFFAAVISLMPGTLCSQRRDDSVILHVLDTRMNLAADLLATERQIARLFGETPPKSAPTLLKGS